MVEEKYRLYGVVVSDSNEYISIDEEYHSLIDAKKRYKELKETYSNIKSIMVYRVEVSLVTYEFALSIDILE